MTINEHLLIMITDESFHNNSTNNYLYWIIERVIDECKWFNMHGVYATGNKNQNRLIQFSLFFYYKMYGKHSIYTQC